MFGPEENESSLVSFLITFEVQSELSGFTFHSPSPKFFKPGSQPRYELGAELFSKIDMNRNSVTELVKNTGGNRVS